MSLWIRTQDKTALIEAKYLQIMQLTEDGFEIGEKTDDWHIIANSDPSVGHYKTKERALEVLDDIQRYLNSDITFNLNVYEMPKE